MPETNVEQAKEDNFELDLGTKFVLGCLSLTTGIAVAEALPLVPTDWKLPAGLGAAALVYEGGKTLANAWVRHSDRSNPEAKGNTGIDNRGDL